MLYKELSEAAKQKALETMWRHAAEGFCADFVIDDVKECAAILGFEVEDIYYSGFSSQGDGACLTGAYRYAKGAAKAIAEHTGASRATGATGDTELIRIAKALQDAQKRHFFRLRASVSHRGYYSHSGTMQIEVYDEEAPYKDIGEAEEDITQALRDLADWAYRRLEDEWDYITSREALEEDAEANEWEFDEDGNFI